MTGRTSDDRGFTMVELLISSMLLMLVIAGVGGIILSSISAEGTVRNTTSAAQGGQLAAASLTKGVRQAAALDLAEPFAGAALVRAMIVDDPTEGTAAAHCEAWIFAGGEIRTTRASGGIPVPADPQAVSGWTLLTTGVAAVDARPIAALDGAALDVVFQVAQGDGPSALIETQAVSRQIDPVTREFAPLPAPLQEDQCF